MATARLSRPLPTLIWVSLNLLFSCLGPVAAATSGQTQGGASEYEPCHLLCSNEVGRIMPSSLMPIALQHRLAFSFQTAYVSPRGHYEKEAYFPIAGNATTRVVEVVASASYQINEAVRIHVALPFEYNYSKGVVLPTLHESSRSYSELEPDGLTVAVDYRLRGLLPDRFVTRVGAGYRLSAPSWTFDVSRDLEQYPDKALEALGFGSDDLFVNASLIRVSWGGKWRVGAGGEGRIHTLPRFTRHYGTTLAYYIEGSRQVRPRWDAYSRLGGFVTRIHPLKVTQANGATLAVGTYFHYSDGLSLSLMLKSELPSKATNRNSLQTIGLNVGITTYLF